jgi:hypothetical protein
MQGLLSGGFADATDVAFPGGLDEYQGVVADGSRLHFGPIVTRWVEASRRRRAGKRARG